MQPSHGQGDQTQYDGQAEATAGAGSQMFQAASQTSGRTTPRRQILTRDEPADRAASIAARNLSPLVSPSSIGTSQGDGPGPSHSGRPRPGLRRRSGPPRFPGSVTAPQ